MDLLPVLRDLISRLVEIQTHKRFSGKIVVLEPASAGGKIAHVPVKHGDVCRGMLYGEAQLFLTLVQLFFGAAAPEGQTDLPCKTLEQPDHLQIKPPCL